MLTDKAAAMKAYLLLKVEERDWHAVSDAANDLRVMEARNDRQFLVERGTKITERVIDGKTYIEVSR